MIPESAPSTTHENPAIIVGLDSSQGLQTARILAGYHIPVIGISRSENHFCNSTNVCERILIANTKTEALIDLLTEIGPSFSRKPVLYPCTDISVLLISRHRQILNPYFHIVLPDPELVELLLDKPNFYSFAEQNGFPIPRTFILKNREDALAAAQNLNFPAILKPAKKTQTWEQHVKVKVDKVFSKAEFIEKYDQYVQWSEIMIGQESIEGKETNLYACNVYYSKSHERLGAVVSRKLRQFPLETGNGCLREEVQNRTVLEETTRLFDHVRYAGLGYLEFKKDDQTGEFFIIEPNIGRPTGGSAIAEGCGIELLYAMYCDATEIPMRANLKQTRFGTKWLYILEDIQSAFKCWRSGNLSLFEWLTSWRGFKIYAIFSWKDPAPFLMQFQDLKKKWKSGIARSSIEQQTVRLERDQFS